MRGTLCNLIWLKIIQKCPASLVEKNNVSSHLERYFQHPFTGTGMKFTVEHPKITSASFVKKDLRGKKI